MALVIMLEFMDEDEAFAYQEDPHLVAVFKRPTLFCERTDACKLPSVYGINIHCVTSSRGWDICRMCGRYAHWQYYTVMNGEKVIDSFYDKHSSFGYNLINKFKQLQIGDKI